MAVKVLFFAKAREVVGRPEESYNLEEHNIQTVRDLVAHVVTQFPRMKDVIGTMVLSVNLDYTPTDSTLNLHSGDEIAFIPPISGG